MKVFILTKQLVLGPTSTQPMTIGVYTSFYRATKDISKKWAKIGEFSGDSDTKVCTI